MGVNKILEIIKSRPAWVNTPVHLWSLYANVRSELTIGSPVHAVIENFEGLACNSIHFIDYIARCNGARIVSIDTAKLDSEWVDAKRSGFMEINGELLVNFSDRSTLRLMGHRDAPYYYQTKLTSNGEEWIISDEKGDAISNLGRRVSGRAEFQSELTSSIIDSIFTYGKCELPSLSESADQHKAFLSALLEHYKSSKDASANSLPIT
jgi:hypothetical protein